MQSPFRFRVLRLVLVLSAIFLTGVPLTASSPINITPGNGLKVGKTKLIIDTDGVSDDVRAISLALQHPEAEVIAITTVHGCANVRQATANVFRTLRANNVTRKIPVYQGATWPLIRTKEEETVPEEAFFGKDGIGDAPDAWPAVCPSDFTSHEQEIAAMALIRLVKENPDATLVCLGPLTNVALAIKLDKNFATNTGRIVIMGGNFYGIGNVHGLTTAEFNFHGDPEAASIVVKEMKNLTMVPWEAFFLEGPEHEKRVDFDRHLKTGSRLASYLSNATRIGREMMGRNGRQYVYCDEIAMSTAINPQAVINKTMSLRVGVELAGELTRGQVAVDWSSMVWSDEAAGYVGMDQGNWTKPMDKTRKPVTFVSSYKVSVVDDWMVKVTSGQWD